MLILGGGCEVRHPKLNMKIAIFGYAPSTYVALKTFLELGHLIRFYCPEEKLIIELDGEHHNEDDQKEYDEKRTRYLESLKLRVIRFRNTDVLFDRDRVVKEIVKKLMSLL